MKGSWHPLCPPKARPPLPLPCWRGMPPGPGRAFEALPAAPRIAPCWRALREQVLSACMVQPGRQVWHTVVLPTSSHVSQPGARHAGCERTERGRVGARGEGQLAPPLPVHSTPATPSALLPCHPHAAWAGAQSAAARPAHRAVLALTQRARLVITEGVVRAAESACRG